MRSSNFAASRLRGMWHWHCVVDVYLQLILTFPQNFTEFEKCPVISTVVGVLVKHFPFICYINTLLFELTYCMLLKRKK